MALPEAMATLLSTWDDLADVATLLSRALTDCPPPSITEGGLFRQGFNADLDELIDLAEHGETRLRDLFESEKATHDLPKLKLGHNRVFGHYLELPRSHKGEVPEHFIRRQTLAAAERYVTPELKALEEKLVSAAEKRCSLEYALFQQLRQDVASERERLLTMARNLADLDLWQALAETARLQGWSRPELAADSMLHIKSGRHPVVEAVQGQAQFVPSDVHLDDAARMLLITGPNMAGKSTVLRQTAIICILAQMGSFVPATEARIGLVDRVFSRVGASDNLAQGQSTFMVEMMETARILRQCGKKSLVILDEIGRGTSTFDGLALAWAVVEELSRRGKGVRTLFATHYHELTALEGRIAGLRNYTMAIKEWKGDIIFLRKLIPGPSDRSYGIEVARLAGVPQKVVTRARDILETLESDDTQRPAPGQPLLPGLMPDRPAVCPETPEDHPVLNKLRDIDPQRMTPIEALTFLADLQANLAGEERS
jgi:DNA mismatch repair protein MutS